MLPESARPWGTRLLVRDLQQEERFYEGTLGFQPTRKAPGTVRMEAPGGHAFVDLVEEPDAPSRPAGTEGLFHVAFLVPSRRDLGALLRRFQKEGTQLSGAADHGVSEALYLQDPEGNGIEIYCDRPREEWPSRGDEIAMGTEPLEAKALLSTAETAKWLPEGTQLGHVHLEVLDLDAASRFFESLGLEVTQTSYPGARFLALDGYHHHVGLNRWNVRRARQEGAAGLAAVDWRLEDPATALSSLLEDDGRRSRQEEGAIVVEDTIGIPHRFAPGSN